MSYIIIYNNNETHKAINAKFVSCTFFESRR